MNCPAVADAFHDDCPRKSKPNYTESKTTTWSIPHEKEEPSYIEAWGQEEKKEPRKFRVVRKPPTLYEPQEIHDKRPPQSPFIVDDIRCSKVKKEPNCRTVTYRRPFDTSPRGKEEERTPTQKDPGRLGRDFPQYSPRKYVCMSEPPTFYWKGHEPYVASPCYEPPKKPLDCQKTSDFYSIDEKLPLRFRYPELIQNYGRRAEHLQWQTENAEYGRFPPTIHVVPVKYHRRNWNYWEHLDACGMMRDRSLNTCLKPCVSKSFECKTLCL